MRHATNLWYNSTLTRFAVNHNKNRKENLKSLRLGENLGRPQNNITSRQKWGIRRNGTAAYWHCLVINRHCNCFLLSEHVFWDSSPQFPTKFFLILIAGHIGRIYILLRSSGACINLGIKIKYRRENWVLAVVFIRADTRMNARNSERVAILDSTYYMNCY